MREEIGNSPNRESSRLLLIMEEISIFNVNNESFRTSSVFLLSTHSIIIMRLKMYPGVEEGNVRSTILIHAEFALPGSLSGSAIAKYQLRNF